MKKIILPLIILISASCKTQPNAQATLNQDTTYNAVDEEKPQKRIILVSMERTPCFGTCPWYKVQIFNDGNVLYHGKKFVERTGWFESRLSKEKLEQLNSSIIQLNAETLQNEYVNPHVADLPSTITTIIADGKEKTIKNGYDNPPASLVNFEKLIDHLIMDLTWYEVEPENSEE